VSANTRPLEPIDVATRYRRIRSVPRMPDCAAWIDGVDLTRPLDDEVRGELRRALDDFEVLCFRPQLLTPDQHLALGRVFGPIPGDSYFQRRPAAPDVEIIENDRERPPWIDQRHTDLSWKRAAPLGMAIRITVTPPARGNTCRSSMSKADDDRSHGIAVWDNRSTRHDAVADDWPHHRVNQRVTFDEPPESGPAPASGTPR